MNEYEKLLQHYGVSTGETPYAGLTGETPEAQAERSAYDDWHDQYKKRLAVTKLYGPGWQGDTLGAPKFTSPLASATVSPLTETNTPAPVVTPVANPLGSMGGSGVVQPMRGSNPAGVNDAYGNLQGLMNTPTGAAGSWLAGKLGMLGNMAQDPSGVPVSDVAGTPVAYGQAAQDQRAAEVAAQTQADAYSQAAQDQRAAEAVAQQGGGGNAAGSDGGGNGMTGTSDNAGKASDDRSSNFASGGLAELNAKYAPPGMEGSADIPGNLGLDMSRVSPEQLQMMQEQDPGALQRGQERFLEADIQTPATGLQEMAQRYERPTAPRQYAEAYGAARKESQADQAAFNKMIEQAMAQKSEGPSKAEMYFNLAAAFGAPTRTGSFTESLGNAGKVMGEHGKAVRESASADQQRRQALGMQAAQARAQASRADMGDLRQLAIQEGKDYLTQQQPQSAAGKEAMDRGYVPGTPGYQRAVAEIGDMLVKKQTAQIDAIAASQGNQGARLKLAQTEAEAKAGERAKLTPKEMDLKTTTEDSLAMSDKVLGTLKEAYKLNPGTFDTSLGDKAQRIALEAAGSKDPKVQNTRLLENMLSDQAVAGLKASFGGNPTEGERAIILSLQGIGAKSVEERGKIIKRAYEAAKSSKARHAARLADINAGKYRETTSDSKLDTGE